MSLKERLFGTLNLIRQVMTIETLTIPDIRTLVSTVFKDNGCNKANTDALVNTIASAERDKALSHGLFRVPGYVAALLSGKVNGKAKPEIIEKTPVVFEVDGHNGFAPLALEVGLQKLSEIAKTYGVGVMTIKRSHHFAALWPETEYLAEQGLIGLTCVSYIANVAPFGGSEAIFGTNPISFAWPRPGKDPVVFDMATSSMAMGEVQIAAREGKSVPLGTGLNFDGELSDDPAEIVKGLLLPFGGHKGSAMALMVELLSAGAVGECFSFQAKENDNGDGGPAQGGQFVLALNPEILAGADWAEHSEKFFAEYEKIEGCRLPGSTRHKNRHIGFTRTVNAELLKTIKNLCN